MKQLLSSFFLLFFSINGIAQTCCVKGHVFQSTDLTPISGATVLVMEANRYTISNADGIFQICDLKPGSYTLGISLVGYTDTTINDIIINSETRDTVQVPLSICEYSILGHPKTCPTCGSAEKVVPILYGMATKKMVRKENKGKVHLGGPKTGCDPVYYCRRDSTKF